MKLKLLLVTTLIFTAFSLAAQRTGISGVVVDKDTGAPISEATVILEGQNKVVTTSPTGDFSITNAAPGEVSMVIVAYGYSDLVKKVTIANNVVENLGKIALSADIYSSTSGMLDDNLLVSESVLEDEEGNSQVVGALVGASDNVYYQTASYDFNVMRFRYRGYDQEYSDTYINGVNFNEPIRGRFNYSMLGGMNNAFRNRTVSLGSSVSSAGVGAIGGTTNIRTFAKDYSPGIRASLAYTNSTYYARAMFTYSTGLNSHGWAATVSAIGRYAHEGIYPGSFYNSGGLFLSLQKVINPQHSLSLTAFGAPTSRAGNSAIYEETAELAGSYRYNPNWGYQNGKKRSARVVESFDPTAILNWVWTPKMGTELNAGLGVRLSKYASSALNWYNAADPRPDYYRYLPSYYDEGSATRDLYTELWQTDESMRQINWDNLYRTNELNNLQFEQTGKEKGSTYILENRHSNQVNYQLNVTLNHRLNDYMTMQAGIGANHTKGMYFKTIKDLLGGMYWRDVDQFSERDFPENSQMLQNDLNNPNRRVYKGDKFGYHYDINVYKVNAWLQNRINLSKWDINYALKLSHTTFQRDGKMRNGRSPQNSYGKGVRHNFDNAGINVGAVYKADGHNNILVNAIYETRAPLADQSYISPRIKDDAISDLKSERIFSADISYMFNYRNFKGVISAYYTDMANGVKKYAFYDDRYSTFMNYVLTNVRRVYKGVEFGIAYNVTPDVILSFAGTYARYQYKNRPTGTRSFENGTSPDTTQTVYLKNYFVGGTPQQAYNVGIDWAAPNRWFFNINASWMGDSYVDISPVRHEYMPDLYKMVSNEAELKELYNSITTQEKLRDAFVLNLSIGKLIYLNRTASMNINLNIENLLNNKKIMTGGYQQGRLDYTNMNIAKFPNKYYYGQGIRFFVNVGVRF